MSKENKPAKLTIEFSNQEALECFASWMSEAGEQDYWRWMEIAEQNDEEGEEITAVNFHYHGVEDDPEYGKFMCDNIIRTTCGRLDKL